MGGSGGRRGRGGEGEGLKRELVLSVRCVCGLTGFAGLVRFAGQQGVGTSKAGCMEMEELVQHTLITRQIYTSPAAKGTVSRG